MGTEPRRYRARHIEPGVISYEDVGQGLVLVGRAALDRMRPSFVGMPVFNFVHKDIEAEEAFDFENAAKETMAVGIISDVGVGDDGWDWAEMLIWDEETQTNIDEKGFLVSCAYDVLKSDGPGKHNGVDYDEEVLDGKYVHMAIVDNPRYEDSTIVRNAKGGQTVADKPKKGWVFFGGTKKNAEPTDEEKAKKIADDKAAADSANAKKNADEGLNTEGGEGEAYCVIDGKKIPLSEVLAAVEQAEDEPQENAVGDADEVTSPSGKKYTGAELMAAYKAKMGGTAENAVPEVETEVVNPEATVKKNAQGQVVEQPNAHFASVKKNAAKAPDAPEGPRPATKSDRHAVGKERYGSAVPGGK